MSRAFREKLAWLPVGLLIGVALTHAYRVEVLELTPWKGGGFGMFSTLDVRENRRLIVELVRQRGEKKSEVPVDLPNKGSLRRLADKARAMPTEERVRALAEEVAKQSWRMSDVKDGDGKNRARIVRTKSKQEGTRPVAFDAVDVTVWRLVFERKNGMSSAGPEILRTAHVAKQQARQAMGAH